MNTPLSDEALRKSKDRLKKNNGGQIALTTLVSVFDMRKLEVKMNKKLELIDHFANSPLWDGGEESIEKIREVLRDELE